MHDGSPKLDEEQQFLAFDDEAFYAPKWPPPIILPKDMNNNLDNPNPLITLDIH